MKTRILTSVLGSLLATAFVITPVFAYHPHDDDGYSNYGYDDDGYEYGDGDRDYSYGGYQDYGYERSPRYGNGRSSGYDDYDNYGYEHPSGLLGYWGKDTRHHSRGHQHHHVF